MMPIEFFLDFPINPRWYVHTLYGQNVVIILTNPTATVLIGYVMVIAHKIPAKITKSTIAAYGF